MSIYDYRRKMIGDTYQTEKPKKKQFWKIIFFLAIIGFVWSLFTYVFPEVTVTVFLSAENYNQDFEVILQQGGEIGLGSQIVFPAETQTINSSLDGTFKATGEKDMGDKAFGQATFYNFTGRTSPITSKIELIHDSGKKYFLKESVTIPQATVSEQGEIVPGILVADVEAIEAGTSYNQPAGRLNISILTPDIQTKIYADTQGLTGGTSDIVKVVSQQDLDKAQEDLVSRLEPDMRDELKSKLKKTNYIVRDELASLEVTNVEKNIELNTKADSFDIKINTVLKAIVFDQEESKKLLKSQTTINLPSDKMIAEDDMGELELSVDEVNFEQGTAKLKLKVTYNILPQTDLTTLKQVIAGLEANEARRELMQNEKIRDVRFNFSMSLGTRIPHNINKIDIKAGN